jgi:hypothetical protein
VEVDGVGNRQACLTLAQDGMRVRRQNGAAVIAGLAVRQCGIVQPAREVL